MSLHNILKLQQIWRAPVKLIAAQKMDRIVHFSVCENACVRRNVGRCAWYGTLSPVNCTIVCFYSATRINVRPNDFKI
jgi:hypothetical protein